MRRLGARRWVALAAGCAVALLAAVALAAPGDLDTSFSGDGKWTRPNVPDLRADDVLVLPDGSLLLVGTWDDGDWSVVRLRADGSALADVIRLDVPLDDFVGAAALQPDGKLVVVGRTGGDVRVARFIVDPSLVLDTSFDGDGTKTFDFGGSGDFATDVLVQPDGKIVLVGKRRAGSNTNVAVARLNADGSFDPTFDGDGIALPSTGSLGQPDAVALQGDGKLVIAGDTVFPSSSDVLVVRLNANGTLDGNFDADGTRTIDLGAADRADGIVVQADGRIVVLASGGAGGLLSLLRFNPDASFDPSFASDGSLEIDLGGSNGGADLALRADGKLVVASTKGSGQLRDFGLSMVTTAGALDLGFDFDGKKTIDIAAGDTAHAVALQPNGAIVIAGESTGGEKMAAARVLSDPPIAPAPPAPPAPPTPPAPPAPPPPAPAPAGPSCDGVAATIVGTPTDDRLNGTPGNDVIVGLGGNDVIDARGGNDVVCAGGGRDVVKGGVGADRLLGQAGADDLRGGAGTDVLSGGAGADVLRGGGGSDTCAGGKGSDTGLGCEEADL